MAAKTGGVTAGTAYSTSKGALQSLTFSLARETCRQGITVNGISPAYVRTPMVCAPLEVVVQQLCPSSCVQDHGIDHREGIGGEGGLMPCISLIMAKIGDGEAHR